MISAWPCNLEIFLTNHQLIANSVCSFSKAFAMLVITTYDCTRQPYGTSPPERSR